LILKMCKSAILMNRGQVVAVGSVEEILDRYNEKRY